MSTSNFSICHQQKNVEDQKMSKEKFLHYAATAIEITKMVAIISANTAIKLFYEGKKEVIKQYAEYNQKSYYKQKETMEKLRSLTDKAASLKPPSKPKAPKIAPKVEPPKEEPKPKT